MLLRAEYSPRIHKKCDASRGFVWFYEGLSAPQVWLFCGACVGLGHVTKYDTLSRVCFVGFDRLFCGFFCWFSGLNVGLRGVGCVNTDKVGF